MRGGLNRLMGWGWRPWVLVLTCGLAACAVPTRESDQTGVRSADTVGLEQTASTLVPPRWWQAMGDVQLNALLAQALKDNPDMAQAEARWRRALALAARQEADSGPQMALSAGVSRQRYSENGMVPAPLAGSVRDSGNVTASAVWSPDWSGLQAAELVSAVGQSKAAQADMAAASNGLAGQVSRVYIVLAQVLAQRELDVRLLGQRQQLWDITRERVRAGLDNQADGARVEGALPEARAALEALDERVALLRRQLAVLVGQAPQALEGLSPRLAGLSLDVVPATLGADLLGRRPDVVAARWRVEAASGGVDAARARYYPNVRLSAFVGLQALGLGQLLDLGSREFGVAPAVSLPLFDQARLDSQLGASRAGLDEAVARYNAAVLQAVREASDALASGQSLERQRREQAQALGLAQSAWALAQERYRAGLGNVSPVLDAESRWLWQQRQDLELQARALQTRVALWQALGGGWVDDTVVFPGLSGRFERQNHERKPRD